jgi:hypothetical protein
MVPLKECNTPTLMVSPEAAAAAGAASEALLCAADSPDFWPQPNKRKVEHIAESKNWRLLSMTCFSEMVEINWLIIEGLLAFHDLNCKQS